MSGLSGYTHPWQRQSKHCIHMKKNSNESTPDSQKIDDSLKALIMSYIDAHNREDHAQAELILHKINEMRRLCDGC